MTLIKQRSFWLSIVLLFSVLAVSCKDEKRQQDSVEVVQESKDTMEDSRASALEKEVSDLIQVTSPTSGNKVSSPLEIKGKARGTWYFEGDFPVFLLDEDQNEIAIAIAVAQGEWMTEDWVPFTATMEFEAWASGKGFLVFRKSNPSDMKELDREYKIPVEF